MDDNFFFQFLPTFQSFFLLTTAATAKKLPKKSKKPEHNSFNWEWEPEKRFIMSRIM